jgi:type II secretory pathway pseudopilin PulG
VFLSEKALSSSPIDPLKTMLQRVKAYSFTLLETMIGLSLAAIFFSALMTSYYQIYKKKIAIQELKKNSLSIELMRQRLIHLFSQATAIDQPTLETREDPQAIGQCLTFTFKNEVDRVSTFCGDIVGMLYRNANKELCFASWGVDGKARNEVFLENVQELCFDFFDTEKKQWRTNWKEKDPLPPFIKISWSFSDQPKEMYQSAFFFPQKDPITYQIQVSNP